MRRRLRQVGVAIFSGTLISLLLLQTNLMKQSLAPNDKVTMLKRSVLHYESGGPVANFEEYGRFDGDRNKEWISHYNPKKKPDILEENSKDTETDSQEVSTAEGTVAVEDANQPADSPNSEEKEFRSTRKVTTTTTTPTTTTTTTTTTRRTKNVSKYDNCPNYPDTLIGPLDVNATYEPTEQEAMEAAGPITHGCYKPKWCKPVQSVAVIIPYKDRLRHLTTLMYHLHPILQRQAIEYCIIVAEQFDNGAFNKARVMNAAFKEITTKYRHSFDCVVFHDVDMLVEDDRNLYRCTRMPRHLSPAIDKFNYTLGYGTQYGGVTAMTVENYKKVNGHSNNFWGWGGEDNDMENRIKENGMFINVTNPKYGRYKMIPHDHPWWFSPLFGVGSYLKSNKHWSEKKVDHSGLNDTLYTLRFTKFHKLWTKITLDIRTFLVEKAIVRFKGHESVGALEQRSSAFNTEETRMDEATFGRELTATCEYLRFTDKAVNKTLGLVAEHRMKYGRMYSSLEKAQSVCDEMHEFCVAIVEQFPGKYSLRATGYMHENRLRYLEGMLNKREVIEIHRTQSVHVKSCQGSSAYLSYFKKPIILEGDANGGYSPAYTVEFQIRLFYKIKKTLYYTSEIVTSYGRTELYLVNAGISEKGRWTTMSLPYNSKLKLLNTSDPLSLLAATGRRTNIESIIAQTDGVITIKTPLNGVLRHPGCYVCTSTLMDEDGAVLMKWDWWFELRGKTPKIEKEMLDKIFGQQQQQNAKYVAQVDKNRQQWLQHQAKMKKDGKIGAIPENIKEVIAKSESHIP